MKPISPFSQQGEPEFERLKRELEDVKNAPRGLEGTFRTAAEMERHRAQLADAAIEEQLEVQTTFREHGARLQVLLPPLPPPPFSFSSRRKHAHFMKLFLHWFHVSFQYMSCILSMQ